MTRNQAKARLAELHDRRSDRSQISAAEWDEIDACENVLARTTKRLPLGIYPACFATANLSEI